MIRDHDIPEKTPMQRLYYLLIGIMSHERRQMMTFTDATTAARLSLTVPELKTIQREMNATTDLMCHNQNPRQTRYHLRSAELMKKRTAAGVGVAA